MHATGKKVGFNAFRRFRAETLRMACVPEDLTALWLGHTKKIVTDFYAGGLNIQTGDESGASKED
jgi:hypothetical protein